MRLEQEQILCRKLAGTIEMLTAIHIGKPRKLDEPYILDPTPRRGKHFT
jgi:hypothetical protein